MGRGGSPGPIYVQASDKCLQAAEHSRDRWLASTPSAAERCRRLALQKNNRRPDSLGPPGSRRGRDSSRERRASPGTARAGTPSPQRGPGTQGPFKAWEPPASTPRRSLSPEAEEAAAGEQWERPPPKEPDRTAHEEAIRALEAEIHQLIARQRQIEEGISEQKRLVSGRIHMRSELDAVSQQLSEAEERKELLLRTGFPRRVQPEDPMEGERRRRALDSLDAEIERLEDRLWNEQFSLAEQKRMLSKVAELTSRRTQLIDVEREQEALRTPAKGQELREQVNAISERIRELRARRRDLAQEYQDLTGRRQREAACMPHWVEDLDAIRRQVGERRQQAARLEAEFERRTQVYKTWLSKFRASQKRAQSRPRSSRAPAPPAPQPMRPELLQDYAKLGEQLREAANQRREVAAEREDCEELQRTTEAERMQLDNIVKFCEKILGRRPGQNGSPERKPPKPSDHPGGLRSEILTPAVYRRHRILQAVDAWHPSTGCKKAYQRARRRSRQRVNDSMKDRLRAPPTEFFDLGPPPTAPFEEPEQVHAMGGRHLVKKMFGGTALVKLAVREMGALREMRLPYPRTTDEVPGLLEEAERMLEERQRRLAEARDRGKELARTDSQLARSMARIQADIENGTQQRLQGLLQEESLQRVAEARESLLAAFEEAREAGPEALAALASSPREGGEEERQPRRPASVRREQEATLLRSLRDCLVGARSVGVPAQRLSAAQGLADIVAREAAEAKLELGLERLAAAPDGESHAQGLVAAAALRQAEAAGADQDLLDGARKALAEAAVVDDEELQEPAAARGRGRSTAA